MFCVSVYIFLFDTFLLIKCQSVCPCSCLPRQPLWHGITLTRPLRQVEGVFGTVPALTSSCCSPTVISRLPSLPPPHHLYPLLYSFPHPIILPLILLFPSTSNHLLNHKMGAEIRPPDCNGVIMSSLHKKGGVESNLKVFLTAVSQRHPEHSWETWACCVQFTGII